MERRGVKKNAANPAQDLEKMVGSGISYAERSFYYGYGEERLVRRFGRQGESCRQRCEQEKPELAEIEAGHMSRCFLTDKEDTK